MDPGHGGIIDGVYQTAGKRSPAFPDGTVLFEGEFNRDIVRMLLSLCSGLKDDGSQFKSGGHPLWHPKEPEIIDAIDIVDSLEDISLRKRVTKANALHAEKKNCIYVSIHANAFGNGKDFKLRKGC